MNVDVLDKISNLQNTFFEHRFGGTFEVLGKIL